MMNQQQMMRQIEAMQRKMEQAQEQLGRETVVGSAGGGVVTITMTGQQEVQAVTISPEAVDPEDVETLQDLVLAAMNDAIGKAQELQSARLGPIAGGIKIPGLT